MVEHTPGPWTVTWHSQSEWTYYIFFSIKEALNSTVKRADANARLIAAAPELLEVLKEAVQGYQAGWHDRARAAIAKARGQEQE